MTTRVSKPWIITYLCKEELQFGMDEDKTITGTYWRRCMEAFNTRSECVKRSRQLLSGPRAKMYCLTGIWYNPFAWEFRHSKEPRCFRP